MVKIVWTELSLNDLKEIFDFIATDSIRYAIITANLIYNKAQYLENNPNIGRIVPEFNIKIIREIICGNFRIIYKINSEIQIDILRIYHVNRLFKKKMGK